MIIKVPATPKEALESPLMGLFEKRRFRNFLIYTNQYDENKPETFDKRDLTKMTMKELYTSFGLQPDTYEFISHAMCLQVDDDHLEQPAATTVSALRCYCHSIERYGTSPYIYPIYGLGGLPEGFSRLCAIHGGTFMLNRDVDEIIYNNDGKACGIRSGNDMARAKMIIGDPSYFPREKVRPTGQIVRCICFLNHPIPNTQDRDSVQIIIPGSQVGRKNDVFVCCLSSNHAVSTRGIYIAIVSTKLENDNPEQEISSGLALLGQILQRFTAVATTYEPVSDGSDDNCFVSSSFDGASHFEQDCDDMLSLYERVTGNKLDMSINADSVESEY
jgi:Rab GDP dissociation inhibitor